MSDSGSASEGSEEEDRYVDASARKMAKRQASKRTWEVVGNVSSPKPFVPGPGAGHGYDDPPSDEDLPVGGAGAGAGAGGRAGHRKRGRAGALGDEFLDGDDESVASSLKGDVVDLGTDILFKSAPVFGAPQKKSAGGTVSIKQRGNEFILCFKDIRVDAIHNETNLFLFVATKKERRKVGVHCHTVRVR